MTIPLTTPRVIRQSVDIDAPATAVWRVLTDSALTKEYMYGCEIVSSWAVGEPFNWKGGDGVVYVMGRLVEVQPNRVLRYTMLDPNATYPDIPANYLTVTCMVVPADGRTTLNMEIGDYATVADGDVRYRHSMDGGDALLLQIKAIAERIGGGSSETRRDRGR